MNKNGEIIIIEDDEDDLFLFEEVFKELNYSIKRLYCATGEDALNYLHDPKCDPFVLLSDINIPYLNGFDLKQKLETEAEINVRLVPYLFFSTAAIQQHVIDAYSRSIQGFFIKSSDFEDLKNTIEIIVSYWKMCAAPNTR